MGKYRVTMKSAEQRGSGKPNIVYLEFASDADALQFGMNLSSTLIGGGQICQARNVSVDIEHSTNYALPYPAGTEISGRCAFGNDAGERFNMAWANCPALFVPVTRVAAIIAAGLLMVVNGVVGPAPTYGNAQPFVLRPSV